MQCGIYSQKVVLIPPGDTVICYSTKQNNWLISEVYKLSELDTLYKIDELQLSIYKKVIKTDSTILNTYQQKDMLYNQNETILKKENSILQSKIKKLKIQKVLSFILVGVTTSLAVFEFIK